MSVVRNERIKYLATLVNTIAAATIVAGFVAPLVAFSFGMPGLISGKAATLICAGWFLTGTALHLVVVRPILGRLQP